MTPHQFANANCANLRDGTCMGIGIRDNGSLFRMWKPKPCDVNFKRCVYFEESLAPTIRTMEPGPKRDSTNAAIQSYLRQRGDVAELLTAKRNIFGQSADEVDLSKSRPCQACGKPVQGIKRFCPNCARNRKREQNTGYKEEKPVKMATGNQPVTDPKEGGPLQ